MVSFLACVVGAICGISGGVVIKPVLDMLGLETVTTISFLSGCMMGRMLNKRMDNKLLERLFIGLMGLIVLICVY